MPLMSQDEVQRLKDENARLEGLLAIANETIKKLQQDTWEEPSRWPNGVEQGQL